MGTITPISISFIFILKTWVIRKNLFDLNKILIIVLLTFFYDSLFLMSRLSLIIITIIYFDGRIIKYFYNIQ